MLRVNLEGPRGGPEEPALLCPSALGSYYSHLYMTESLHCTVETKHNAMYQLYFNKTFVKRIWFTDDGPETNCISLAFVFTFYDF